MSEWAHDVIGPRRQVTLDYLKNDRFPWGTFPKISSLYHFCLFKKGGLFCRFH
jgi:hypothetical protein